MADNRYSWLDATAAEHLLRGETADALAAVGSADKAAREQALELAAAMEAMAGLPVVVLARDGELAGEAEAVRAFRGARPRTGRAGAHRRSRRAAGAPAFGRPLWAGLGVAFSAALLGGAAIASGALPKPFGDDPAPLPASTISAVGTPSGTGTASAASGEPAHGKGDGKSGKSKGSGSSERGGSGSSAGRSGEPGDGQATGPQHTEPGGGGTVDADVCREYRDGTLDEERERSLEKAAGGPEALDRQCDALLGGVAGSDTDDGGDSRRRKGTESTTDPVPTTDPAPTPGSTVGPQPLDPLGLDAGGISLGS